jgi:DNA polymerase III delta subunit
VLNQLLKKGERPERILGGLRYSWENSIATPLETRRRLKALLNCDIDIKTGRLKADFALERLVVSLCSLAKPSG